MNENQEPFINETKEVEILKENNLTIYKDNVKKKEQIPHFNKEEMNERLSRMPPNRYNLLFQVLWRTGIRVSEAIGIRKQDVHFDNEEIRIRWLKNRKYETRVIPMHKSLKLPLYSYLSNLNAEDRLFSYTRQYVDQLCKKYGFEHAHKIRHSFAVNFLRQSNNPTAFKILQHLLGHSNIQTTMVYLAVVPMEQKQALNEIDFD